MGRPAEDVSGDFLHVQDNELKFAFELRKQVSTTLQLTNKTSEYVAFKVKTTAPKKYCVRPNAGLVAPQAAAEVVVTMQAQKEAPEDLVCKDKFLVQSVVAPGGAGTDPASAELFSAGKEVKEVKLKVSYVSPAGVAAPSATTTTAGTPSIAGGAAASTAAAAMPSLATAAGDAVSAKDVSDLRAKLTAAKQTLAQVTEERNAAIREAQSLQKQQLQVQEDNKGHWSTNVLLIVALLCLLVGYLTGMLLLSPAEQEL